MKNSVPFKCYSASLLLAAFLTAGCSNIGKSYSQIDPEGAKQDVLKHNGYYALKQVASGSSKLVVRNRRIGFRSAFETNSSSTDCNAYEKLGTTVDAGRGVLLPWVADLSQSLTLGKKDQGFIETTLVPGQSIQVRAHASMASSGPGTSSASCDAVYIRFTPEVNRAYLVELNVSQKDCVLSVVDASNPDAPVQVPTEQPLICTP